MWQQSNIWSTNSKFIVNCEIQQISKNVYVKFGYENLGPCELSDLEDGMKFENLWNFDGGCENFDFGENLAVDFWNWNEVIWNLKMAMK